MMRHFSHVLMSVGCLLLSTATVLMATELHVEYGQVAHWLTAGRLQVTPDNANINTDRTEPYEVIFALKQQNIEKIEELLQHISNPSDEEYGLYWTEDALKQVTFCEEGLQSLEAYLKRYHIVIPPQQIQEKTSYLKVSATIQQWEEVFQTTFQSYAEVNGPFTGLRASSLSLPVDIWQHLQGVFNVIDLPLSSFTSNVDDSVVQSVLQKTGMQWLEAEEVISPTLLRQLYDMPATSSFPGYAAVSQAIFASNHDDRNISRSDLQKFLREYSSGVSMTEVTSIGNRLSYPPCTSCALSESSTVAMEYLTTLGRDIATTFYYKERKGNVNFWVDWVLEISRMKNSPNVIAITTYDYEADVLPAIAQAFNIEVMKLGIRGVTVLVTSGVDGVAGPAAKDDSSKCGYRPIFPATSPFVTVVGSTMGIQNEVGSQSNQGGSITSGGGFSNLFGLPSWQEADVHQYLEDQCTQSPTIAPSSNPSFTPSAKPTEFPTITPTVKPTLEPTTNSPSLEPTSLPTFAPTLQPTTEPTNSPSVEPTLEQSLLFSTIPSESPTNPPTLPPSESPSLSSSPTEEPRIFPTLTPTGDPTEELSVYPTLLPSDTPTITVSLYPTVEITAAPTEENTEEITTAIPTTFLPTILPTPLPTFIPTLSTLSPTLEATEAPSEDPTEAPFVVNAQVMHSKNTLNDDHASELYYLPKVPLFVPKNQEIKNRKLSESYRCSYGFPTEGRAYPDVAVLGSNFQFIMNNVTGRISSTQAVAVFASMVSLVNARRLSLGKPSLGWINPSLYKYQSLFAKDIIQGDNRCTRSTCCSQGFSAGRGWDPMTGIGSLNFSRFSDVFTNTENITTSTFAPTAAPTPSPTARPTPTPSAAPSNRPPSASPTRQFLPVLQFNSIIKIQGLLSLNISAATKLTILQAQAQSLGIDVRYLEFVGFANSTEEALKRMTLEMELLAFDIVVITRFILPLVDFPAMDGNVTKLFSTIKNTLQIAMNNGNLLKTMQEITVTYNSTELSAVSLSEIAFTQAFIMQPPTHFPTLVPITRPSAPINDGAIAGIVIGVLLIVFATSYAIYRYILYRQGQQSNGKIQVRIHRDYQLAVMKEMVRDPNQIHVEVGNRMLHTSKEVTKRGSAFLVDEVYATPEGKPPSSDIRFSNSKFRDQRAKFKPYDPEMQQLQPVSLTEYTVQY